MRTVALLLLLVASPAAAHEAVVRGFPSLRDLEGRPLADGSFAQWVDGDLLTAVVTYDFPDGRRVEETSTLQLRPALAQRSWSWRETKGDVELRRYSADLASGRAEALERRGQDVKRWSETIDVDPGRTFCGFGFSIAIEQLLPRILREGAITLNAVVFMPKPRTASVEVSDQGIDRMRQGGRALTGRHVRIRPRLPSIARAVAGLHDYNLWLTEPPEGFLRAEGPLAKPRDPVVRVDLLTGQESGPAENVEPPERARRPGPR